MDAGAELLIGVGLIPGTCPNCGASLRSYVTAAADGIRTCKCGACGYDFGRFPYHQERPELGAVKQPAAKGKDTEAIRKSMAAGHLPDHCHNCSGGPDRYVVERGVAGGPAESEVTVRCSDCGVALGFFEAAVPSRPAAKAGEPTVQPSPESESGAAGRAAS